MILNPTSQTGNTPQPTTLSVGETTPLSSHTSNSNTMEGFMVTRGGSTVYTLWSSYSKRGVGMHITVILTLAVFYNNTVKTVSE